MDTYVVQAKLMTSTWRALISVLWILNLSLALRHESGDGPLIKKCPDSKAKAIEVMIPCFRSGEKFLRQYIRRYNRQSFDTCSEYEDFKYCMEPLLIDCPGIGRHVPEEWLSTMEIMNCACNPDNHRRPECSRTLGCIADELDGIFVGNCHNKLLFNIEQGTQSKCHFLYDYVHCKKRLVTTACGINAGNFVYLASQIEADQKEDCVIRGSNIEGFEYSPSCPPNLPMLMESCLEDNLKNVLTFEENNDLVPIGSRVNVENACNSFNNYKPCMQNLQDKCPVGVDVALQENNYLRTYWLKMNYICSSSDYRAHIPCYQTVLSNDALSSCAPVWDRIEPFMKITPYQFYCEKDSNESTNLQRALGEISGCYSNVFAESCGEQASDAMSNLISQAFHDSYYMQYDYTPDCDLHTRARYDAKRTRNKETNSAKNENTKPKIKVRPKLPTDQVAKKTVDGSNSKSYSKSTGYNSSSNLQYNFALLLYAVMFYLAFLNKP